MVEPSAQAKQLPTVSVVKLLAAGWRFRGYGYVQMWVLEEKWKEEEEEEEGGQSEL